MKYLIALALLVAAFMAEQAYEHHLIQSGVKIESDRRDAAEAKALKESTAAAMEKERVFNAQRNTEIATRLKEKSDYENRISALQRAAAAGHSGLRCPSAAVYPASETAVSAAPSGPGNETGRELVPQSAVDLLGIAGGIRQRMQQYNALVDQYEVLRQACIAK